MLNKIIYILKKSLSLIKLGIKDANRLYIHQYLPAKPRVINLNANDVCNSMCVMCNIWQNQPEKEIAPNELKKILNDRLFKKVHHVGITGGEPTLRDDIAELFEACCITLPRLKGLSIITNAIESDDVIMKISQIKDICFKYKKGFSVMVSLDGIGHIHERIRRRLGNFDSVLKVIKYLKDDSIPFSLGCTISKKNLWYVDEVLDFVIENGYKARFRVAEFINRLYNDNKKEIIRNFNEEEKYHLINFFYRLIYEHEKDEGILRTYKSIISILTGGNRLIGCPYQNKGVVLNSKAEIAYCAPKSSLFLPTKSEKSYWSKYKKNLNERRNILKNYCNNCIHDYHAPITLKERLKNINEVIWENLFSIKTVGVLVFLSKFVIVKKDKITLITGWYGTETTGDKAILGGIIRQLSEKGFKDKIVISSIHPHVTEKTIKELEINATVVKVSSFDFIRKVKAANKIIIGGGPLMDIEVLSIPLLAFKVAKRAEKIVWGCGIGPLKKRRYIDAVIRILMKADEILLRDQNSVLKAKGMVELQNLKKVSDPAKHFVDMVKSKVVTEKSNYLVCFIREWTDEYKGNLSDVEYYETKQKIEKNIANIIKKKAADLKLVPYFVPMHTFTVGGDDRTFYRRFVKTYFQDEQVEVFSRNSNVNDVVKNIINAKFSICMRYHSVLFANELEADFMALDYTNGGKIEAYLKDNNALDRMISFKDISI